MNLKVGRSETLQYEKEVARCRSRWPDNVGVACGDARPHEVTVSGVSTGESEVTVTFDDGSTDTVRVTVTE